MTIAIRILLLFAGHALCDYPLQGDFLAKWKNHRFGICFCGKDIEKVGEYWAAGPEVCKDNHWHKPLRRPVPWWQAMAAHSFIHAGMVYLVTRSVWMAIAELGIHFVTDYAKCDGRISFNQDQAIHYACKVLWAVL